MPEGSPQIPAVPVTLALAGGTGVLVRAAGSPRPARRLRLQRPKLFAAFNAVIEAHTSE